MSTNNLCFEQKYEKYRSFLSQNFQFLEVKFSLYLNRRVFVMLYPQTICMKFLSLFSEKNLKKYFKMMSAEIFTQHAKH